MSNQINQSGHFNQGHDPHFKEEDFPQLGDNQQQQNNGGQQQNYGGQQQYYGGQQQN